MTLEDYKKKRNFNETTEPKPEIRDTGKNIFVVQKHQATRLHYDFRLEWDGVLKSWAIPKGPSINPSIKRLAIQTEDHPIDYAEFEGSIPKGNYGAGTVIIWDKGTYKNHSIDKNEKAVPINKAYQDGHITIILRGDRLKGEFAMIKMKRKNQWLLIKKDDEFADRSDVITDKYTNSLKSQKKLDDF